MIEINNLCKKYHGKGPYALNNVSLKFEGNEIVGLVGPNGAGKTTLLKAITDIVTSYTGEIKIAENSTRGLVLDNLQAYNNRTLGFNLNYFRIVKGLKDYNNSIDILKKLDFDTNLEHKKLKTFSYGMNQKVITAISLMSNPDIVLLDEPFRGLDFDSVESFKKLLNEFKNQNKLVIFSSHNLKDVETICDRVVVMNKGEVLDVIESSIVGDSNNIIFNSSDNDKAFSLIGEYNPEITSDGIVLKLRPNEWKDIMKKLLENDIEIIKVDNNSSLKERVSALYKGGYNV